MKQQEPLSTPIPENEVTEADRAALHAILQRRHIQPPTGLLQKIDALIEQERAKEQGHFTENPNLNQQRTVLLFLLFLAVLGWCLF